MRHQLAPGIWAQDGEMHINEERVIRACGGDPRSERDRRTAREAIRRICAEHGIPVEERDE